MPKSWKNRGFRALFVPRILKILLGEGKASVTSYRERNLRIYPDPSFTPSSLPVLVPVLDLSRSHSVAPKGRENHVVARGLSHLVLLNRT